MADKSKEKSATNSWAWLLEGVGADSSDLDDLVHDAASQQASSINNGGIEEQIRFIGEHYGEDTNCVLRDRLIEIARENRNAGATDYEERDDTASSDDTSGSDE